MWMNKLVIFCGVTGLAWSAAAEVELHPDTPRYTAEQVLNGEFPGRKASPVIEAIHDASGFASERLYSVPAPGVHPRILFGADDLPRLRKQIRESASASVVLKTMRSRTETMLSEGWGAEVYQALVEGDLEAFARCWEENSKQRGSFRNALLDRAFIALLDDDREVGERNASAIATYAAWLYPQVEEASLALHAGNHSVSICNVMGADAGVSFMYDFSQPFMTDEQAAVVRKLIALETRGRYSLGMDLPPHWVNWNYIGFGVCFPLTALAIEGEEGYDPRIYKRACDVVQNYILYGNSANGVGQGAMWYHTGGLNNTAVMMLAMANRGNNVFTLARWRRMFDTWGIYAMQPYGKEWQSSGDLGTYPPNSGSVNLTRFLFPSD